MLDDGKAPVDGGETECRPLLGFPLVNLPSDDISQRRIGEQFCKLCGNLFLFLPAALVAGRKLFL